MAATIYARVSQELRDATGDFASEKGMTLANAVTHLLELGLQAASNESSVSGLEAKLAEQTLELATLRKQGEQVQLLGKRLDHPVGRCPRCSTDVSGRDLLAAGECPNAECKTSLLNVIQVPKSGFNEGDVKVALTALGLLLGFALLARE